ncbi:bacterial regulatory s, tetR family protein [Mycobacterium xenopi 4042]|uniref:Bacterial regulatory s, tetR family protein n=1 Tax=Mycobacterium xenopi 4042 TaxID=1299334 RepID=X8AFL0_MYCXE|nr:bacterial regulatory s, tetR family protein [Mycobacterium xenopi 4042]
MLLDAAEQLMLEEGYAAVTSRRVAQKAALKPQLVHYYFRTMDDLFLAAFRRRAEEGFACRPKRCSRRSRCGRCGGSAPIPRPPR